MSNKSEANSFEDELCEIFGENGWWAHRLAPNKSGAQPFDVIAIKRDRVCAVDCKICVKDSFPLSRIEDNQWSSFNVLYFKTFTTCGFAIKHNDSIYWLGYLEALYQKEALGSKSVKISDLQRFENVL